MMLAPLLLSFDQRTHTDLAICKKKFLVFRMFWE